MKIIYFILILNLLLIAGCTWVNENTAGRSITTSNKEQVTNCKNAGSINAKVKHKVGFISRNQAKVKSELLVLARNEAVKLKANTIVANGEPFEGQQKFQAFNCPQKNR